MATGYWLAGHVVHNGDIAEVREPGTGRLVGEYVVPSLTTVGPAVARAVEAMPVIAGTSTGQRAQALDEISMEIHDRCDEIAELISAESGKPIFWSKAEVTRAISTFRIAAEEAKRFGGTFETIDLDAGSVGRAAIVRRFPLGPVLAIAPFNFPLNLVAHKVAPAIAVGAPVVVKPSPRTPLSALLLGELVAQTDLPAGVISVLPGDVEFTNALVADKQMSIVSFTGSDVVGAAIAKQAWDRKVILELGGNGTAIVCADYADDESLAWAAKRIALYSMYQAGQSCISVQRVLVARSVQSTFMDLLKAEVAALGGGSAMNPGDMVGPVIDEASAQRIEQWVSEAVAAGGTVLCGNTREGMYLTPTIIDSPPVDSRLWQDEIFGPVAAVVAFDDLAEAFAHVNDSRFGLQCGVFTHDLGTAFRAYRELDVGGVVIGDVPSFRADALPYGGNKQSGRGREGVRAAMEDYTQARTMVITDVL